MELAAALSEGTTSGTAARRSAGLFLLKKLSAASCAASFALTAARNWTSPAQACSRNASRSAACSISKALQKISSTLSIAASMVRGLNYSCVAVGLVMPVFSNLCLDLLIQPRFGAYPMPGHGTLADAERLGDFLVRQ